MSDDYDLSSMIDDDTEIAMVEITQAQYDQYAKEAEDAGLTIHEYIQLAMEDELFEEK